MAWIEGRPEDDLYLSVLTFGELEKGIAKLAPSSRRTDLETWVRNDLNRRFADRILPIDAEVATRWGSIAGASEANGRPLPVIDGLIAASSMHHGMIVATRNVEDFERCGARCTDPWQAS
jgi:toxin FitB